MSSICSDEIFFTVESGINYQNDTISTTSLGNIPEADGTHFKEQKQTDVIVSTTVSSNGSKSELVFIEE